MDREDINGFLASLEDLNANEHVFLDYTFETFLDPIVAAAELCQETSTAQWKRPGVDEDLRPVYAAKLVDFVVLESSGISTFYERGGGASEYIRVKVKIAHPLVNFGTSLAGFLTAAMGEGAFFSHGITAIKLVDVSFPPRFLDSFEGPAFGISGLRDYMQVYDRPFFFGVVKPNVGLDPKSFSELAYEGWLGGLDAAKDDEMLVDPAYSPFETRTRLVGEKRKAAEDKTGEPKMFIANITHDLDRMLELSDIAVSNGVNAVMINVMAVGLAAARKLRGHLGVPLVAHFDCIAPMSMHPWFGVSTKVMTKLQRLIGCDAIIMPGFGLRMKTPDEEVIDNVRECTNSLGKIAKALPVPGGSDWAGSLRAIYDRIGHRDFAMVPGRGVFGHPKGPRSGAASLRQAWDAISGSFDISDYARRHPELSEAIDAFGGK